MMEITFFLFVKHLFVKHLFVKHLFVKHSMIFIEHQPRPSLQPARLESIHFCPLKTFRG